MTFKSFLFALLFLVACTISGFAQSYARLDGFAETGDVITTSGLNSTNKARKVFPGATITVYQGGSLSPATIYSDSSGTAKANPFTADSQGRWEFYALPGTYDIRYSGTGITSPFTITGYKLINLSSDGTILTTQVNEIRYASQFPGSTITAKIVAAIADLPSTGGTVYATFEGAQTLSGFTIDKNVHLILGSGTYTQTGTITITAPVVTIEGQGAHATSLLLNANLSSTTLSGTLTVLQGHITIKGINFNAQGNASTYAVNFPSTAQLTEGRILIEQCQFRSFTNAAIYMGTSNYHTTVRACEFYANTLGLDIGEYADVTIIDNSFYAPAVGAGVYPIKTRAQHSWILHNYFIPGGATGGADINVLASSANSGYVWISQNKFGNESEAATRKKILISSDSSSYTLPRISITDNNFLGVAAQTAIGVNAFTQGLNISNNWFEKFSTVIDDNFPAPTSTSQFRYGENIFRHNQLYQTAASYSPMRIFSNGGNGFMVIDSPDSAEQFTPGYYPAGESLQGLVNRVNSSESSGSWTLNGVTTTDAQTDPAGTSKAILITRSSGSSSLSAQLPITLTGLKDLNGNAASGRNGVVYANAWFKAGTINYVTVTIYNVTDGQTVLAKNFELAGDWKRYSFAYVGLDTTKTYRLSIYPGGIGTATSGGTMSVAFLQLSDYYNSDYLPTTGTYATSSNGRNFQKAVNLNSTLSVGSTLAVTGTSTFTGATTHNGGITTTTLSASGTSTLTGNVGIGTTSGTSPLSVKVGTNNRLLVRNSGGSLHLVSVQDDEVTRNGMIIESSGFTFRMNSTDKWGLNNAGVLYCATDGGCDLGLVSSFRPANVYASATIQAGTNIVAGGTLTVGGGATLQKFLSTTATIDFPSTGAAAVSDSAAIPLTGAALGDTCTVGPPNGSVTATATFSCWVSSAGNVTVRFSPKATEDPASGTFRVVVTKF